MKALAEKEFSEMVAELYQWAAQGNAKESERILTEYLDEIEDKKDYEKSLFYSAIAGVYQFLNDFKKAYKYASLSIDSNKVSRGSPKINRICLVKSYIFKADLKCKEKEYSQAALEYSKAVELACEHEVMRDVEVQLLRGAGVMFFNKKYRAAEYIYSKVIEVIKDRSAEFMFHLFLAKGINLYALHEYRSALVWINRSLDYKSQVRDGLVARALNNKAGVLIVLKKYKEAKADLEKSLTLNPNYETAKINLKEVNRLIQHKKQREVK